MDKLYRAGATHVVSPNVSGANRMAAMLVRPSVVSFLDIATRSTGLALRMEEIEIREGSWLAGKTLAEAKIPQHTRLIVLALMRQSDRSEPEFNPGAETELHVGDELIVLGKADQIDQLRKYLA